MGQHTRTARLIDDLVASLGPGPWPVRRVVDAGLTRAQIRRAVQAGRLVRTHRGVLALPRTTSVDVVRAALLTAPAGAVVSHRTAAELHGLWTPSARDTHVHLTVPGDQDEVRHGVRLHGSRLPTELVTTVDGIPVTSVARTAVDVARLRRLPEALMVLDSSARVMAAGPGVETAHFRHRSVRTPATRRARGALWAAYQSVWSWPGSVVVKEAIPHVDAGSESPFESSSRGRLILERFPSPLIAQQVQGASGTDWWVDFVWERCRVVGEADGLGKYLGTDAQVREALVRERRRQADLEAAGWTVIRWDPREPPRAWLDRLRNALTRNPGN